MENKQRPVIAETRELVQKYHVLEKAQIYAYFALDGRDHFVGKAFKALEKERQVYIYPELDLVAASEEVIADKDLGTMRAVWVLLDVMKRNRWKNIFLLRRKSIQCGSYSTERVKSLIFCTFQRQKLRWQTTCFRVKELTAVGTLS